MGKLTLLQEYFSARITLDIKINLNIFLRLTFGTTATIVQRKLSNVISVSYTHLVSKYFSKGKMIALKGSIQTRSYEDKQGNKRTAFEVVADKVYFCGSKEESNKKKPNPNNSGFDDFDGFEEIGTNDDDLLF